MNFNELKMKAEKLKKEGIHLVGTNDISKFSKIGGTPFVPAEFEWPAWNGKSLAFIMQLKFSEINGDGQIPYIPKSGLLYIFYDQEQSTWGFDPKDQGSWKLQYFPETEAVTETAYPEDMEVRYKEKILSPNAVDTFPSFEYEEIRDMSLTDEQWDWYDKHRLSVYQGSWQHQIGGHPNPIQNPGMDLECELVTNGLYLGDASGYKDPKRETLEKNRSEWILLMQIDSDDDAAMMWGDAGMLYFWIKKADLQNLNFNNVWMILQCC